MLLYLSRLKYYNTLIFFLSVYFIISLYFLFLKSKTSCFLITTVQIVNHDILDAQIMIFHKNYSKNT
jgi:hypothetical protein